MAHLDVDQQELMSTSYSTLVDWHRESRRAKSVCRLTIVHWSTDSEKSRRVQSTCRPTNFHWSTDRNFGQLTELNSQPTQKNYKGHHSSCRLTNFSGRLTDSSVDQQLSNVNIWTEFLHPNGYFSNSNGYKTSPTALNWSLTAIFREKTIKEKVYWSFESSRA